MLKRPEHFFQIDVVFFSEASDTEEKGSRNEDVESGVPFDVDKGRSSKCSIKALTSLGDSY